MKKQNPPIAATDKKSKTRRRPGSFVIKLTLAQSMRMLRLMIAVDIMMIAAFALLLFGGVEKATAGLVTMAPGELPGAVRLLPVELLEEKEPRPGIVLHRQLEQWLDTVPGATRTFVVDEAPGRPFLGSSWEVQFRYTIAAPAGEARVLVAVWDLTEPLDYFAKAMLLILIVETVLLISHTAGARRAIRRILAPIQQLTAAARTMSVAQPAPQGYAPRKTVGQEHVTRTQHAKQARVPNEKELSGTIDALNRITAGKLDARIPVEGERHELRGLASAINNMLERLDTAYSSQLRFVSDASHELRTPIAVLQGYANMLDRWGKEDPAVLEESIEAIKAEAEGMKVLVEQLLFLARGDNNTIALRVHPLAISELVDEVVRDARLIDGEHEFSADVDAALALEGDNGLLKQALRIFVDNAVKYSPDSGKIRISAQRKGEWMRISVTDNGIGIPEEDLPHVFERFYRSDESRARATGGTGLGLSIAQWIVERHGGYLEIVSRKDFGTRMTMVLPAVVEEPQAEEPENTKPQQI